MRHMGLDQMARSQGAAKTQLTRQHAGGNDASELTSVVARVSGVSAFDTEEIEHGLLGFEDGAAADGADFDAGHGDADLEVPVVARVDC